MDEIEIQPQFQPEEPASLILLPEAQYFLIESGKWARFLGIMGFIGAALMAFLSLFMGVIMSAVSHFPGSPAGRLSGIFTVVYLPIAVFYFFVALYLYQFGTRIKEGIAFGDAARVSDALGKLKSMFKLTGITTIVIVVLYVLILIAVIVAGAAFFTAFKSTH